MRNQKRRMILLGVALTLVFGIVSTGNAMHIMEGFLPKTHAIAWGVICLPFIVAGFRSINKTIGQHRKALMLLVMMGAYAFVLSSLKIPSVTGSCSHPTGTGLGAVMFGPTAMCVLGIIVLLFQAILLAHGGLTTLGANTFSMAIAGPILSYAIYKLITKSGGSRSVAIFFAASLSDLFTYCVTSFQLAIAYPSQVGGVMASLVKFMGIFAYTQIPLAIIEGFLAVAVLAALESFASEELEDIGFLKEVR